MIKDTGVSTSSGTEALFVHPPTVETMQDPLAADWNRLPEGLEDDLASSVDFGLMTEIFENFLAVIGLPIAIIDLSGHVLASSRWQRLCMEFHRRHDGTLARCLESDVELSRSMAEGSSYALYRCRNGLTDCATPIVVDGIHLANLFIGQFLLAPPDLAYFQQQQQEFGFDREAYFQALAEVPIVSEQKLPAILKLMAGLAQQIARQSLSERRVRASYAVVEKQVAERTRELAESYALLNNITAHTPGVVYQFVREADGRIHLPYASPALRTVFGLEPRAVRDDASEIFAAIHPDDRAGVAASIDESAATLAPWRHEFRAAPAGQPMRWLHGEAMPQRGARGAVLWHGFITDITDRKSTEVLMEARLRLVGGAAAQSLRELLVATLDEVCQLTDSEVGFYHFLESDQATLSLQAWSTRTTRDFCQVHSSQAHYPVHLAGVWADCVRRRRSVVYNDYASLPNRQGLPEGHAPVRRLMSVPIIRDGQIIAVIGVGNKATDYEESDLATAETLADMAWDLAERKQAELALAERTELMQRRYESLRALNDIAGLPRAGLDHQIAAALALGARHLGLPVGIVSRIEDDTYTIMHHHAPAAAGLADGQMFDLAMTYCAMTLQANGVVAIAHIGASDHAGHPCYGTLGLEAYIAAPVMVGSTAYGTVNFSSPQPYHRDFDDGDREFVHLLARWVGAIIEREQAEASIVAAKETAEQRAAELASSNADLEQFAYVASHDLREPLRMVNTFLGLVERGYADKLDDEGRQFIAFARDGALHMNQLILDLLDYARVGRHGRAPQPVDLATAAADAVRTLRGLIVETGCRLTIAPGPVLVAGHASELARLFQNLIGNAIKYRAADRPPQVAVSWRMGGGEWIVAVKDNGIGIAANYHADIFKIFRRLHGRGEYDGTGIGLAICLKIVKNHGGRIWLESEPGRGSTFLFSIPALPAGS